MNVFRAYDGSSGTPPAAGSAGAERRIRLGRIDIEAKNYFSDSGRFADALNYCLYGGQPVIEPDKLSPLDTEAVIIPYGNEAREPEQRYRDLLDLWQVNMTDLPARLPPQAERSIRLRSGARFRQTFITRCRSRTGYTISSTMPGR